MYDNMIYKQHWIESCESFLSLQVSKFGCESFALLFDDIETELCLEDEKRYGSLGAAQADLTNAMYHQLPNIKTFLFCPTGM